MQRKTNSQQSSVLDTPRNDNILSISHTSRRALRRDQHPSNLEPIPLYDVGYNLLEYWKPPVVAFFDQFSAPGAAPFQLDIFWIESNICIVCSQEALEKLERATTAQMSPPRAPMRLPSLNLFTYPSPEGPRAKYSGLFEFARNRQVVRLPRTRDGVDADKNASLEVLRTACRSKHNWALTPGMEELLKGEETFVDVVRLDYKGEDQDVLRRMMGQQLQVGWLEPKPYVAF
ncbi:unnamed protein product [Peniophora sp. CBMAI 1063]|nr:unnamed protein product [Peniophora sp. CBMAI 1063]